MVDSFAKIDLDFPSIHNFVGIGEPLIISKPNLNSTVANNLHKKLHRRKDSSLVSLLDIVPTILEWHDLSIPGSLTGKSLLPYLGEFCMLNVCIIILVI